MNTKNYLTPTKKYKSLISATHSVYRLVNSTYELKDLISRMSRMMCQIFNAQCCLIELLDHTKEYSLIKCLVSDRNKYIIDKRLKVTDRIQKNIIRKASSIRKGNLLGIPLICEDIIGVIILKRNRPEKEFDIFDQEMLMAIAEQAITGIKNLQLYEEQQKILLGSIKSLVTLLDTR
ncbi:MAG: GAF domain-containing protein, partial [Candidatus Omnitrophota bacterium]|nr:GAF domain-containing protein [Candidatus Omnitrophota bacterium]